MIKNNNMFKILVIMIMFFALAGCNKNIDEEPPVHVHEWSSWETTKQASCKEEGLLDRHCTGCDEAESIKLNKVAHTFNEGIIVKESSCKEEGLMEYTCSTCEKVIEQKLPTLEHNVVKDSAISATCYEDGLTEGSHCDKCGTILVEQQVVKATGHAWGKPVTVKKATCEEAGSQKITCNVCRATREQTIAKLEHNIHISEYIEPTCTQAGVIGLAKCDWCENNIYEQETLNPVGHNYISGVCIRCKAEETDDGMKFEEIDGEYYLADVGVITTPTVVIPVMYNNSYVVGILDGAFQNAQFVNTICLPKTISTIEVGAFDGCGYLQNFLLDKDNPYLEVQNSCIIDSETKVLLAGAANATIPEGVVSVGSGAFKDRIGVTIVSIPKSVESIADDAFAGCNNILLISVAEGNKNYYSEDNCIITKNDKVLFLGCQKSEIPDGILTIGTGAFAGCEMLTKIKIPNSVTTIMPGAFQGCMLISKLEISESVTELTGAFEGLTSLAEIVVAEDNPKYTVVDNCIVEKETSTLVLSNKDGLIPEGTKAIGTGAFAGNLNISTITLPETVTTIGERAFADCKNLMTIVLTNNVTSIGNEAFSGCINFKEIIIPDSVTSLGDRSFEGCINLQRIELSKYITYIGERAFNDCDILVIACEAKSLPKTWASNWNPDNRPTFWNIYIVN